MPLALTQGHYDTWLDPHHRNTDYLRALLNARPVSTAVNNVRNHGPHLLDEVA
ncbi:hypothetical protein [Streptomyces sp. NPDC055287]